MTRGKGLFVTFEGPDGSGKSTQHILAGEALEKKGTPVVVTRNPGGTEIGKELRQIVLHHPGYVSPICELMLYIADRTQQMSELVKPSLEAGKVVLCDRHIDSSVAYQGYGRGLDIEMIHQLNTIAIQGQKPDVTFLFDGPAEVLLARVSKRGEADRLEKEAIEFHHKVRNGYLEIAKAEQDRFVVLDATQSIEELHQQVMAHLEKRIYTLTGS